MLDSVINPIFQRVREAQSKVRGKKSWMNFNGNLTPAQHFMLLQQQRPMVNQIQSDWRGTVSNATREDFISHMYKFLTQI
jgi:hypothetical protein